MVKLTIGTRGSALALAQANWVKDRLLQHLSSMPDSGASHNDNRRPDEHCPHLGDGRKRGFHKRD